MNIRDFLKKLQNLPDKQKKIILWTIVAILAATMGFFWLRSVMTSLQKIGENVSQIKLPEIQTPATETPSAQTPADQTADRKTYKNDEYGFEFEYPSYARVEMENGGGFIAAVFSAFVVSPDDNKNIIFPTTIRIYTKKDTPDIYNSSYDQDTEYLKIIETNDFLVQIFANKGVDIATFEMVKSTFKFIE